MSNTREPRVAVVGATGAVGNQLIELIAARGFQLSELKLFATEAGAMQTVDAAGEERLVDALESPADLRDFDIAALVRNLFSRKDGEMGQISGRGQMLDHFGIT